MAEKRKMKMGVKSEGRMKEKVKKMERGQGGKGKQEKELVFEEMKGRTDDIRGGGKDIEI